jgi:hypothetical protein
MKNVLLALAATALLAASARAEYLNTEAEVISLPAFVVEASRLDAPSADLALSLNDTRVAATAIASQTSDRSLDRLKHRLPASGRHLARLLSGGHRPRA